MESPRLGLTSGRRRRPLRSSASSGPRAWLQHPVAAALIYMSIGGALVYMFLGQSYQRQQRHQLDGVVKLAAVPAAAAAGATLHDAVAAAATPAREPSSIKMSVAPGQDELCQDTCFKARDGICDDGRFLPNMTRGLPSHVSCDLGTDCSDCGPWAGVQHSSSWHAAVGPVEYLRQHNHTLLTKRALLEPKFHFAYTDPSHDVGISHAFDALGTLELRLAHIAYHVLHAPCQGAVAPHGSSDGSSGSSGSSGSNSSRQLQQQEQQQQQVVEGLMLDVGANFGFYSLLAGTLGCRVIAWEPVKTFQAYLEYGIARNKLQHKIEVRGAALTAPSGGLPASTPAQLHRWHEPKERLQSEGQRWRQQQQQQTRRLRGTKDTAAQQQQQQHGKVTLVVPSRGGIWGTASIEGRNMFLNTQKDVSFHKVEVPAETLDVVVLPLLVGSNGGNSSSSSTSSSSRGSSSSSSSSEGSSSSSRPETLLARRHSRVALLKVDVEGYEPEVLAGAAQLLQQQLVDNVIMEYSPMTAQKNNITQLGSYPNMLLQLLRHGFHIGHVAQKDYGQRMLSTYSEPLLRLQAVTEANLKFDLFDCMQMTEKGLAWLHEPCTEMSSYRLIGEGVPERLHPKSFRSTFELNTNVWASRQRRYMPYLQGPPVGIFPLDRQLTASWFIPESSDVGMGGRTCTNLREVAAADGLSHGAMAALLVSNRCRCKPTNSPCAQEEQLAEFCAQAGKTPFRDEPDYVAQR